MSGHIIVPKSMQIEEVPTVKWKDHVFPIRSVNEEAIPHISDPKVLVAMTVVQIQDHTNLLWAGLYALAKDVYRKDQGMKPQEFLSFVEAIGLRISDAHKNTIDTASELTKILNEE